LADLFEVAFVLAGAFNFIANTTGRRRSLSDEQHDPKYDHRDV
jgi:hypothetical protein